MGLEDSRLTGATKCFAQTYDWRYCRVSKYSKFGPHYHGHSRLGDPAIITTDDVHDPATCDVVQQRAYAAFFDAQAHENFSRFAKDWTVMVRVGAPLVIFSREARQQFIVGGPGASMSLRKHVEVDPVVIEDRTGVEGTISEFPCYQSWP